MIDKIIKISKHKAFIIYTNRVPIELNSDEDVTNIIDIALSPIGYEDNVIRITGDEEDTVSIAVPDAA